MTVSNLVFARNQNLDLLKWIAIISMTIDHARYLMPEADHFNYACYIIGRLAYPLFLLLMAHYFYRTRHQHNFLASDARYLKKLILFAIISEIPFQIYFQESCLNIFPTLILNFVILYAYVRKPRHAWLYFLIPLILIFLLNQTAYAQIQYGLIGCFSILLIYLALIKPRSMGFAVSAAIAMNIYYMLELQTDYFYALTQLQSLSFYLWISPVIMILALALPVAYQLQKLPTVYAVPPIGKFAYVFYPLHISLYCILRYWINAS